MNLAIAQIKEHSSGFIVILRGFESKKSIEIFAEESKSEALKKARKAAKNLGLKIVPRNYAG